VVKPKEQVLCAFDYVGRDDYLGSLMDRYCGQKGTVIGCHPTNGVKVAFEDGSEFDYEPGCLDMVEKKDGYVNMKRLLRETKVRVKNSMHEFFGRKGFVILDIFGDDEDDEIKGSISRVPKIAVDLGDIKIHVEDVDLEEIETFYE